MLKNNSRKVATKDERRYFLIVCEGEKTEPNYFIALGKELPKERVRLYPPYGAGDNTLSLIDKGIQYKNKLVGELKTIDEVWFVFDRDSFPPDNFDNAIHKVATLPENKNTTYYVAWSNQAFELWYLLHFMYCDSGMERTQYRKKLEELVCIKIESVSEKSTSKKKKTAAKQKEEPLFKYEKNDPNMYSVLQQYGNETQAIINAERLEQQHQTTKSGKYSEHNPCTTVYKLVSKLRAFKQ